MKDNKNYLEKGQTNNAVGSIITLIIGIGISVLVLVFIGVLGGRTYDIRESALDSIANNVVINEGLTLLNGTAVQLAHNDIQSGTLTIQNASEEIGIGNYTAELNDGVITLNAGSSTLLNNSNAFANYTWGEAAIRNSIKDGILSGFNSLETTGDFLPIIVLAVVIALVLTLVLGFAFVGGRGGGRVAL